MRLVFTFILLCFSILSCKKDNPLDQVRARLANNFSGSFTRAYYSPSGYVYDTTNSCTAHVFLSSNDSLISVFILNAQSDTILNYSACKVYTLDISTKPYWDIEGIHDDCHPVIISYYTKTTDSIYIDMGNFCGYGNSFHFYGK